jgi:hypothetical protein
MPLNFRGAADQAVSNPQKDDMTRYSSQKPLVIDRDRSNFRRFYVVLRDRRSQFPPRLRRFRRFYVALRDRLDASRVAEMVKI